MKQNKTPFDTNAYWRVRLNTLSSFMFAIAAVIWMDSQIWFTGGLLVCALFYGMAARRDRRLIDEHEANQTIPDPKSYRQLELVRSQIFCEDNSCRK